MVKPPKCLVEFRIALYALKEFKGWTDADIAKRLGVTERTVRRMRQDPFSANGGNILKVQEMLEEERNSY